MSTRQRVAVSGTGCLCAAGITTAECLSSLDKKTAPPVMPFLFTVENPQPAFHCNTEQALLHIQQHGEHLIASRAVDALKGLNRTAQLAIITVTDALIQAGWTIKELQQKRVGVCIGTSVGASLDFFEYYTSLQANNPAGTEQVKRYRISNPAEAVARFLGLNGPVMSVTNACSSGTDAIGIGALWIKNNLCDIVIAGGADALSQVTYIGFQSLKITSSQTCRPFDKERNGLNLGEGAGICILEAKNALTQRDRPAIGYIAGYGTCTDAHHLTAPHPEARGLTKALRMAVSQSAVATSDIGFINAHGTATPTNDRIEGFFLQQHFPQTPFLSTKGATGHTLGAAGAIEAVFTLGHLNRQLLPASPGFIHKDPQVGLEPTKKPTPVKTRYALSQSLAFGGNNSLLILQRGDR